MNHRLKDALDLADRLAIQPELVISGYEAKRTIGELARALNTSGCYRRAMEKSVEVFVLVEPDECAPLAIEQWIAAARARGAPESKLRDAEHTVHRWRNSAVAKKVPD